VLLGGAGIVIAAIISFRRALTTVNPLVPERASALIVSGVYRLSRNPMYLGMALILFGWAILLANALALTLVPVFVAWIDRFQIAPEEEALALRFGADFAAYKASTRRWV
jgi:protein-S-isoprenylcysteine O-methyltransferase Ste14